MATARLETEPFTDWSSFHVACRVAFFVCANHQTKKQHAQFGREDLISAVENVLSETDLHHDEWDLFLGWPIKDPFLQSIRQRCVTISKKYSGEKGTDISTVGEDKLRLILNELRGRT